MSKVRVAAGIPVLMRDNTSCKLPRDRVDALIAKGDVKRRISNTIYRAMQLGIEVKNFDDRDESGKLRAQIRAARDKKDKSEEAAAFI